MYQVVGSSAAAGNDQAVYYDNLCTFQNSGPVGVGYLEESATLSSSYVNPDLVTAQFTNSGEERDRNRESRDKGFMKWRERERWTEGS